MEIIDDTALRLRAPPEVSAKLIAHVERSELINDDLLVYWDYPEASYLATLLDERQPDTTLPDVPSPMIRDYKWPGRYIPFHHQKVTASYLSLRRRAFCFNEAGTGKTSAAVWAADYLMTLGIVKRVLIVCPLSIMYSAWQADVFNTAMHRSCGVAHGDVAKRRKIIKDSYEFVVINYDGINVVRDDLEKAKFDLIIVDEANSYKSATTKRWRSLARIVAPSTYMWFMTGTPASQSPIDAFGLAKMISPHRVPKYVTAWRDKVMIQTSKFTWSARVGSKRMVFEALQPAIRYTKKECLDLPEVMYQTREVPLTTQVHVYYKRLKSQMLIEAAGEQISAVNAASSLTKLLQLSGGAVYTDEGDVVEFDISPRLNALEEVLDETENKVIVFVPYRHTIEVVTRFLRSKGHSTEVINGDVSAKERANIINRFQQQKDPHVLVIQPQAASHGVTLTAADTVVFWSPVMSVETYLQCIARIDRVGQKNSMTVVHLQGSDVERKVYKMLQGKVDSHQKLVDLYKEELNI
jgi:SNF2 family DNA or RNA helicase